MEGSRLQIFAMMPPSAHLCFMTVSGNHFGWLYQTRLIEWPFKQSMCVCSSLAILSNVDGLNDDDGRCNHQPL